MGNASDKEQREVECLSSIYPEIRQAIDDRAKELEMIASHFEAKPSKDLKSGILSSIKDMEQEEAEETGSGRTKVEPLPLQQPPVDGIKPSIERPQSTRRAMWIGIAASVLLLVGAVWVYYSFDTRYQQQLTALEEENEQLEEKVATLENNYQQQLSELASTHVNKVNLNATTEGSEQQAIVFWNAQSQEVLLNPTGLSQPPEGKQYQLWALKDGNPIDLGVFDPDREPVLRKMSKVSAPDAFAITMEPEGGKPQPTMDQLQVMGEVRG